MAKRTEKHHSRLDGDPATMGFSVLLSCLLSLVAAFLLFPPARRSETVEESMKRFGYEGPTRYEREIEVHLSDQVPLLLGQNRLLGALPRAEAVAGAPVPEKTRARRPGKQSDFPGLAGLAESGSEIRRLRHLNLPTVQSEDLIIVELIRPEYPREAVAKGDTGRVELLALVNVHGTVDDIEVVRSAGNLLDGAAAQAVRRCRFLPYRVNGEAQPVFADFHFNFTLLDN
jgi:TonB family protein